MLIFPSFLNFDQGIGIAVQGPHVIVEGLTFLKEQIVIVIGNNPAWNYREADTPCF